MTTKKAIVSAVSEKLGITQLDAKEVVQNVLDCIGMPEVISIQTEYG